MAGKQKIRERKKTDKKREREREREESLGMLRQGEGRWTQRQASTCRLHAADLSSKQLRAA